MIPCNKCLSCNRKGKPSVMRGSAYCDSHIKIHKTQRINIFQRFKNFITEKRKDKKTGKFTTTKGFRPSWFWRG